MILTAVFSPPSRVSFTTPRNVVGALMRRPVAAIMMADSCSKHDDESIIPITCTYHYDCHIKSYEVLKFALLSLLLSYLLSFDQLHQVDLLPWLDCRLNMSVNYRRSIVVKLT